MRISSFREAFGEALVEIGEANEDIVVLDADLMRSTYTHLFASKYPDRFIQIGISEQDMIGTAAGLAIAGKIPIASSYAMFLMRAWEQVRNTIARDSLNVKLVGTHSGLSDYLDGSSHQCTEDIAVMRVIPNMTVVAPSDAHSLRNLLFQCVSHLGPVYMRIGRDYAPNIYDVDSKLELGRISVLRRGEDVCLVAYGIATYLSLHAAEALEQKGIKATVIDVHTIKPIDSDGIVDVARDTGRLVVVEEHNIIGGLGSAVSEILSERYPCKMLRIGINDLFGRSSRDYESLLHHYGLTIDNIIRKVGEILR